MASPSTQPSSSTNPSETKPKDYVFKNVMSGNWEAVFPIYEKNEEEIQKASITSSKETLLHIAISDNKRKIAEKLLNYLTDGKKIKEMKNDRENNPLHLAAALGQVDMCEKMVDKDPVLIRSRNLDGESPLFLAALHGKMEALQTLQSKWTTLKERILKEEEKEKREQEERKKHEEDKKWKKHEEENIHEERKKHEEDKKGKKHEEENIHEEDKTPDYGGKDDEISHCRRNDGNTILHVTILGEYFDLAFQIMKWYPNLGNCLNVEGQSPLHVLALHSSSFRSGCHFGPLDDLIYRCLLIEEMEFNCKSVPKGTAAKQSPDQGENPNNIPPNYETCFDVVENFPKGLRAVFTPETWESCWRFSDIEKAQSSETEVLGKAETKWNEVPFPPNYYTFFWFFEFVLELLLGVCGLGFYKVTKIKEKKRKHTQSFRLMKKLVDNADMWKAAEDTGLEPSDYQRDKAIPSECPPDELIEEQGAGAGDTRKPEEGAKDNHDDNKGQTGSSIIHHGKDEKNEKNGKKKEDDEKDKNKKGTKEKSPFLVAAKMGVTEMVEEILQKFPVAIDDMNQEKKNAVLLAVENRQPKVYSYLKKRYPEKESIFQKVDSEGNSALHLAAKSGQNSPWLIPGAALQLQWELKWYKFIKDSMPRHFFVQLNSDCDTPREVLTMTHKELVQNASKWLTKTSESCSVVAALIATVAFASATTLPGGVKQDIGTPVFEGEPPFDVFAISSVVALCFSITSLTMFLSILTSRYEVWDFQYSLPSKMVLGLTSLFVSITSILVSFCSGHFLSMRHKLKHAVFPIYVATCLPLTLFAVAQFPLYLDLIRSMMAPVPKRNFER